MKPLQTLLHSHHHLLGQGYSMGGFLGNHPATHMLPPNNPLYSQVRQCGRAQTMTKLAGEGTPGPLPLS